MIDTIRTTVETFFRGLGITIESLTVTPEDTDRHIVSVHIETPDSPVIIGVHGRTLESINQLLARMIERMTDTDYRLRIEVNDYVHARDEKLFRFVDRKIASLLETKRDAFIGNLTSYQRKKIHDYVSAKEIAGLRTYSVGEDADRKLCITLGVSSSSEKIREPQTHTTPIAPPSTSKKSPSIIFDISEDGVGI